MDTYNLSPEIIEMNTSVAMSAFIVYLWQALSVLGLFSLGALGNTTFAVIFLVIAAIIFVLCFNIQQNKMVYLYQTFLVGFSSFLAVIWFTLIFFSSQYMRESYWIWEHIGDIIIIFTLATSVLAFPFTYIQFNLCNELVEMNKEEKRRWEATIKNKQL